MNLGKNIYDLRKSRNVTQEQLAAELGVTAAAVSKWETGNTLPDVLMVCAIADFFDVTTDELLGRSKNLKKLILLAGEEDRKTIDAMLKRHGFCAAAYCDSCAEAGELRRSLGAAGVLHIGHEQLSEQELEEICSCKTGRIGIADCVYDEPQDFRGNLDTILTMMEGHF